MGKRYRDLGFSIGMLPTGSKNCITDVSGVYVGHPTLKHPLEDDDFACTGVTAILPHEGNVFRQNVHAPSHLLNGFRKASHRLHLNGVGRLEPRILIISTCAVPALA